MIEQAFGLLKSRFRCLHHSGGSLQYAPRKCANIVGSCLLLHNLCIERRIPLVGALQADEDNAADDPPEGHARHGQGHATRMQIVNNFFYENRENV